MKTLVWRPGWAYVIGCGKEKITEKQKDYE